MIQLDNELIPEELGLPWRGEALMQQFEEMVQNNLDFIAWLQAGIDDIEAGNYTSVFFDDTGVIVSEHEYRNGTLRL